MKFYYDDYLKKNINVRDNKEHLVEAKFYTKKLIIRKVSVLKEGKGKIYVRKSVAKMLKEAEKYLPPNYQFILYDGFRPKKTQRIYFKNHLKRIKEKYPEWKEKKLKREASKFVANSEIVCPHNTGGAIDVSLAKNRRQIPMGGFHLYEEKNVSKRCKKNREFLKKILSKVGFVNYPLEWWHWSYGDRYWAAIKKRKYTIYKEIE